MHERGPKRGVAATGVPMRDSQHITDGRDGRQYRASSDETQQIDTTPAFEIIALDDALKKLFTAYPEHSRVVELRFFGGLTSEETSEALGLSLATVEREWCFARAWLRRELNK